MGREGSGVVNINGGEFRINNTGGFRSFFIGVLQNGNGTVNVNNAGIIESDQQIEVGTRDFYPTGVLNINSGGVATANTVTAIGPNGAINVNGGLLNTGNVLIVGDLYVDNAGNEGSLDDTPNVGDLNINAGSVVFNQNNVATPAFIVDPNARIFIDDGSLILNNPGFDYTNDINTLVTNGQIVAASGKSILVSYDGTDQTMVTASATASVNDINANNYFKIYPNPTEGLINVKFTNAGSYSLEVVDVLGATVYSAVAQSSTTIDLTEFAKGVYTVKVSDQLGVFAERLIVQ